MVTLQRAFNAFLDQTLACPGDRIDAGVERGGDLTVAPALSGVRGVGFQQDASLQQVPRGVFVLIDRRIELLAFLVTELHDVFFDGDLLSRPRIDSIDGCVAIESQRAESRTRGTRCDGPQCRVGLGNFRHLWRKHTTPRMTASDPVGRAGLFALGLAFGPPRRLVRFLHHVARFGDGHKLGAVDAGKPEARKTVRPQPGAVQRPGADADAPVSRHNNGFAWASARKSAQREANPEPSCALHK
jgi:hypothetical protein